MGRIYHPYWDWEEYKSGMWKRVSNDEFEKMLPIAIDYTSDHIRYGNGMRKVIDDWIISCENSLSNKSINRMAWIGHAAVTLEKGIPEHVTRKAWWHLTDKQKTLANKEAEINIKEWERRIKSGNMKIHGQKNVTQMAFQMKLL